MRRAFYIKLFSCVICGLFGAVTAADTVAITRDAPFVWLKAINNATTSGVKNRDIDGATAALLFPLVSQQPPQQIEANFERQFKLLQEIPVACSGKKIYTPERARLGHFSDIPQLFSVGLRLFVVKDSAYAEIIAELAKAGRLSMATLANSLPRLMVGAVAGRSYTPQLDDVLQQFASTKRLWLRSAEDMASGMTQMLVSQRVDAIVEYPTIMADFSPDNTDKVFVSYQIIETPAFTDGYILCAATPQGEALVKRFNAAIRERSQQRDYLDAHLQWFEPARHNEILAYYNKVYGTHFVLDEH